jgi:hypothetical protein
MAASATSCRPRPNDTGVFSATKAGSPYHHLTLLFVTNEAYVDKGYRCDRSIDAAHRMAGPISAVPPRKVHDDQWPLGDLALARACAGTLDQSGITCLPSKGRAHD